MKKLVFGFFILFIALIALIAPNNVKASDTQYYKEYDYNVPVLQGFDYYYVLQKKSNGDDILVISTHPIKVYYATDKVGGHVGNYVMYMSSGKSEKYKIYNNGVFNSEGFSSGTYEPLLYRVSEYSASYMCIVKDDINKGAVASNLLYSNVSIYDNNDVELFPKLTNLRYKATIPVPQKLKMYRQYAKEDAQHWSTYVSWVNPTNLPLNYKLQIEVGGKYEIREHWYSISGTVVDVPWHNYAYSHNVYGSPFSFKNGTFKNQFTAKVKETWTGSLYEPNSFAFGYKFRLRYYYVDGDVTYYGPWAVTETNVDTNDGSSNSYVTDDKGNKITNDNYTDPDDTDYNFKDDVNGQVDKDGTDYKPLGILEWVNKLINGITDFFTSLVDMIGSLTQSVGFVPKIMGVLMEGVPTPIWDTLKLGLTLVIALGVIKVIRG